MAITNSPQDSSPKAARPSYPLDEGHRVSTPEHRTRRQLLKSTVGTLVVVAVAYLGWTKYLFPPAGQQAASVTPKAAGPPTGTPLGKLANFPVGDPPKLLPATGSQPPCIVENLGGGQFRVLLNRCTHLGCKVDWDAKGSQFVCPCHGATYDITGRNTSPPAPSPLPPLPYRVEGDTLFLA